MRAATNSDAKFILRLPLELRDEIKAAAVENARSMNSEILARIGGSAQLEELRDRLAGQALIGLLASPENSAYRYVIETAKTTSPSPIVAALAYELADAMLVDRAKAEAK